MRVHIIIGENGCGKSYYLSKLYAEEGEWKNSKYISARRENDSITGEFSKSMIAPIVTFIALPGSFDSLFIENLELGLTAQSISSFLDEIVIMESNRLKDLYLETTSRVLIYHIGCLIAFGRLAQQLTEILRIENGKPVKTYTFNDEGCIVNIDDKFTDIFE